MTNSLERSENFHKICDLYDEGQEVWEKSEK